MALTIKDFDQCFFQFVSNLKSGRVRLVGNNLGVKIHQSLSVMERQGQVMLFAESGRLS